MLQDRQRHAHDATGAEWRGGRRATVEQEMELTHVEHGEQGEGERTGGHELRRLAPRRRFFLKERWNCKEILKGILLGCREAGRCPQGIETVAEGRGRRVELRQVAAPGQGLQRAAGAGIRRVGMAHAVGAGKVIAEFCGGSQKGMVKIVAVGVGHAERHIIEQGGVSVAEFGNGTPRFPIAQSVGGFGQ